MTLLLTLTHLAAAGLGALAVLLPLKPQSTKRASKMSDKFIQVVEKVGEDIAKVVTFPFTTGSKLVALLHTAQVDGPSVASAIDGLIQLGSSVALDAGVELAADGTNLPEYLKAGEDAKTFFLYFKQTFLPTVEKLIADSKQDFSTTSDPAPATTAGAAAPAPAPAAAAVVQTGPGLHTVVPA